jgi:hypothetical protein
VPLRTALPILGIVLAALLQASCSYGASPDKGLDALLRVSSAQFVPGAPPPSVDGGPQVNTINSANNSVHTGQVGKKLDGTVDLSAATMALYLKGDVGYWIVPADVADVTTTGQRLWSATVSFSPLIPPGAQTLIVEGVDQNKQFGPPETLDLRVQGNIPSGDLVVSLAWDTEADLDLHVVDPSGVEIWSHKPTDYKPTTPPLPAAEIAEYGHLDFDSNASCAIDGRRQENVVWGNKLQTGHYIVRVDTTSLCGQPGARWTVDVRLGGTPIANASGQSGPTDTRFNHLAGAGVLALEFDVPTVPVQDGG